MSKENDQLLELIAKGDTLQAVSRLSSAEPGSDRRLALNRALYTGGEADSEEVRAADAEHRALLAGQGAEESTTILYNLGCLALSQDDIVEARLRFSEVLEREPQHTLARHNLAYAHELLAESDDARREYRAVLAQNAASALTRLNLAQLSLQEGDAEGALRDLEALRRGDAGNMGLLLYLCRGLLQRGGEADLRRVLELLEGNAAAGRFVDLQECRAYALYRLEDFEQAEKAFHQLLDGDPDNAFALGGMIKVLAQRGDFAGMRAHLERYQALNPSESGAELLSELASA